MSKVGRELKRMAMGNHKHPEWWRMAVANTLWFIGVRSVRWAFACIGLEGRKASGCLRTELMRQWRAKCMCEGCARTSERLGER